MNDPLAAWLTAHCALLQGARLGAVFLQRSEGLKSMAVWPPGRALPPALAQAAVGAMASRQVQQQAFAAAAPTPVLAGEASTDAAEPALALLAHPLIAGGVGFGAVVLLGPPPSAPVHEALARHAADFIHERRRGDTTAAPEADAALQRRRELERAADALALSRAVFSQPDFKAAAHVLAAQVAQRLQADRVSLGVRLPGSGLTQLVATSDAPLLGPARASHEPVLAAIDEAIDEADVLIWPPAPESPPRLLAAHAALGRQQGLAAVASVPLVHSAQVLGALVLERGLGRAPSAEALGVVQTVAATVAPWLALLHQRQQPWPRRVALALRQGLKRHAQGTPVARPVGMAVAVLGALLLLVWPVAHPVQAQARLEGRIQHALAAPADGFLREVQVRPGDAVKAGQTLLRLDGEDLSLQLRQLDAELAGEDAQLGDALQRGDRIRLALASARVGELQARRQGLAQQLARAELKAPFDGVVIAGDVVARLGAPVQRGETLLTLAPADGLRAIVEVSDSDIAKVAVGQAGQLVLAARPNSSLAVAVTRLTPLATAGGGRNWFEAEVTLQPQVAAAGAASGLLPGMRGIARLEGGTAPRAWHWAQAGWGQLRLALFRWWP